MRIRSILTIFAVVGLLAACGGNDYSPKPQAYLRIDMPAHAYQPLAGMASNEGVASTPLPFSFEVSTMASPLLKKNTKRDVWIDIQYPQWNGVVFLSYKHINGATDLRGQLDTSSRLMETHYKFASGIDEQGYEDREHSVYGTVWHIKGRNVASSYQFYCTDSAHHFLRGALYINCPPNNDSLAPVLEYMQADVDHLVESLRWR